MAEQNPNARPDEQTPEQDALEKSLEELSLDELLASVKDDLARVDAMMDGPGDAAQPEQPDAPAPDTPDAAEEAPKPGMQPLFEPKIPEEYADLTVDQETQPESQEPEKKRPRLPSGIRVLLYVCCVLAVAVLLAVAVWRCADDVLSLTKEDAEVTVSIPDGATISQIAGELKSKGLVRYETLFKFYCWASHAEKTIEPGTYTLNSRYDYHALVSNMIEASPDRAVVEVTIPEGCSSTPPTSCQTAPARAARTTAPSAASASRRSTIPTRSTSPRSPRRSCAAASSCMKQRSTASASESEVPRYDQPWYRYRRHRLQMRRLPG